MLDVQLFPYPRVTDITAAANASTGIKPLYPKSFIESTSGGAGGFPGPGQDLGCCETGARVSASSPVAATVPSCPEGAAQGASPRRETLPHVPETPANVAAPMQPPRQTSLSTME